MYRLHCRYQDNQRVCFYYDEQYHILFDYQKNILPIQYDPPIEDKKYSLRLAMGLRCNSNCKYCNKDTICDDTNFSVDFIDRIMELTDGKISRVEFWGGEPLLYFDRIIKIIEKFDTYFKDDINFHYGTTTNGILLKEKHIQEFILDIDKRYNKPRFIFSISHDGDGQILRGNDILKNENIVEFIKHINSLYPDSIIFNPVISKYNFHIAQYPIYLEKILGFSPKFYEARPLMISHADALKCMMSDEQLKIYLHEAVQGLIDGSLNKWLMIKDFFSKHIERMSRKIKEYQNGTVTKDYKPKCLVGNKYSLVLDTDGNILPCQTESRFSVDQHGNSLLLANIFDIKKMNDIPNSLHIEWTKKKDTVCSTCLVRHMCGGGCPFTPAKFNEANCKGYFIYNLIFMIDFIYKITGAIIDRYEYV